MNGWEEMLDEYGITEERLMEVLKSDEFRNLAGEVFDDGNTNIRVVRSDVHGEGVFAQRDIQKGEVIGNAAIDGKRTFLGRYTNHSDNHNAKFYFSRKTHSSILTAEDDIAEGEEIFVNYRHHTFNREYYD